MYAIIEDGGKQYRVSEGDALLIERRELPEGQTEIVFDTVLMVGQGADVRIGTPHVSGARVTARLEQEIKLPKVVGILFRRRKGLKKKFGHRQRALKVRIEKIHA